MPMYRMLRSRTIDNSNGSSDSPARARVAGAGARKSSAGTNQQNQKKMSVPGSPTKNRPGPAQSKKYSIGATMVTSPLVASSGPPIALPKAPYSGSVDITSGTQTPASPAAASLKKQRWSFAFRKRWFSSSVSTNSSCNSPVLARAAKVSVGSQGSDIRRQSEGSYTHEASTSVDPGASTSAAPPPSAGGGVQKRTSLRQPNTEITNKVSAASPLKQKGHIHRLEVNRSVIRDEQPILDSKINFRDPASRFFNNSHNNQQNQSANNSAARLSSSNDPAAPPNGAISTTSAVDTSTPPAVLSAPGPSSLGSGSATSAIQQQSASSDPEDLPPPMNELNSTTTMTAAANDTNNFDSVAGCSTTTEMNESTSAHRPTMGDLAQSNPEASGVQADEQPTSAAGTPQGTFAGNIAQMSPEDAARVKREYVIKELVETERLYVQDLGSVVEGYIANLSSLELPEDLQGKDKIIFANIAQICDFHKTIFLKEIEKCLENYEAAGNAFVKYERRLSTYYVKYCQNKPKSDFLVSQESFDQFFAETKQQLGHKVALCDLLIKPVQRITKYQLMLADVLKYTQRAGDRTEILEKALDVMRVVPKACDDMMQVGRLQNFEGNLNAQGRLLFQGTLQISDGGPNQPFRGKERRVFLFEQSAIIADCIPPRKEYGNPTYIFKNQIMVNKMVLEENVPDEPLRFILTSNDPSQPAVFIAQASSMDDKEKWLQKISAQLDQQKTFLAALVDPKKYQNQLASSVGSLSLSGKKDSSGSLGTPCGASSIGSGTASPKQHAAATATKSTSKLFGFGKSK